MAFVRGKSVYHGTTGKRLSTHKSPEAARQKMEALHKEHKPKAQNRGKRAAKRFK